MIGTICFLLFVLCMMVGNFAAFGVIGDGDATATKYYVLGAIFLLLWDRAEKAK